MARASSVSEEAPKKIVALNKKARFQYEILETFEAGIVLTGSEIKSIRQGGISITEAYIRPGANDAVLLGANIKPYEFSKHEQVDADRPRKLLLKKNEIDKLRGRVQQKGLTIVPLSVYLKRGRAKIEIALARGKDAPDKRHVVKKRDAEREISRYLKR